MIVPMKYLVTCSLVLIVSPALGQSRAGQEWTLNLAQYGLIKTACARYPGHVEFLDDNHLVVSAPVSGDCKSYSGKPMETRITETDLQGNKLADLHREDVANLTAGPKGFVILCTGNRVELLSHNLLSQRSIAVSGEGPGGGCDLGPMLTPSHTAFAIKGPGSSQTRLYEISSNEPITEITTSVGQSVRALADHGFLVCTDKVRHCDVIGPHGSTPGFAVPQLSGAAGSYIVGLVAPDKLLLASFDGKRLYAETHSGTTIAMGDVAAIKPPFINSGRAQMSVSEPRRILYSVDGCPLGDFDDCYGVVFHRFAVYDSQTAMLLFRHSYRADADLKISPNGHLVMVQDGPKVHFFRVP